MNEALMKHVLRVANEIKNHNKPYSQQVYFNECGTPSCLAGYCCVDEVFNRAGLKGKPVSLDSLAGSRESAIRSVWPHYGPVGNEWQGITAMAKLLDLNDDQTTFIFGTVGEIEDMTDGAYVEDANDISATIRRVERVLSGEFE